MSDIFEITSRPSESLFYRHGDRHDPRLGEIVSMNPTEFEEAAIVIIGCPQDEGVVRAGGTPGSSAAPDAIRQHFYKLTNFGIHKQIFDIGNVIAGSDLEATHERLERVVREVVALGKRAIVLGGGGDIAHPGGTAMAGVFGLDRWIAINVDARLDIAEREVIDSESAFRKLLESGSLLPQYLYEIAFQPQYLSNSHYRLLTEKEARMISLQMMRSRDAADTELRETIRQEFIHHSRTMNVFFCFDMQAVRASEAPGVTHPNPFGLRAGEFLTLVDFAANLVNTKLFEFCEVNPTLDQNGQTARLVAVAMHRICSS